MRNWVTQCTLWLVTSCDQCTMGSRAANTRGNVARVNIQGRVLFEAHPARNNFGSINSKYGQNRQKSENPIDKKGLETPLLILPVCSVFHDNPTVHCVSWVLTFGQTRHFTLATVQRFPSSRHQPSHPQAAIIVCTNKTSFEHPLSRMHCNQWM